MKKSRLIIIEDGQKDHLWWHSWIPNWGVSYTREKLFEENMIITRYKCKWCSWTKKITQVFE